MRSEFTPNYFLFPPDQPERFRWTQKARQELGPRFARCGIRLDDLRTDEEVDDAIAAVIVREYEALSPEQKADGTHVRWIYDLQFVTDPLHGIPSQPIEERRAARNAGMARLMALQDHKSPDLRSDPDWNPREIFNRIVSTLKRLTAPMR